MRSFDRARVLGALSKAWSLASSSQWLPDNPAQGLCNVTAILLHDLYGADVLKTSLPAGDHFYNRVNGDRVDLTASQFIEPVEYADVPASREEALSGTSVEKYASLRSAYLANLK